MIQIQMTLNFRPLWLKNEDSIHHTYVELHSILDPLFYRMNLFINVFSLNFVSDRLHPFLYKSCSSVRPPIDSIFFYGQLVSSFDHISRHGTSRFQANHRTFLLSSDKLMLAAQILFLLPFLSVSFFLPLLPVHEYDGLDDFLLNWID